ncbi:hypothetical protein VE03_06391 [Pseudogymnoascus sp. 23342-1-I1]|nr:hypothetical protein VE03_06391 [Pseudogymnoascus sp. 23342-1-I1]
MALTLDKPGSSEATYLVDGDSTFGSATEAIRRRKPNVDSEFMAIVVGVGYHLKDSVFSPRRDFDLTPPSPTYTPPEGPDGIPRPRAHGGADKFLDFLEHVVRPFIYSTVFPDIEIGREALFGHSYGGLFALHALFTRPSLFDMFIAASPSIWWNDRFILEEERRYRETSGTEARPVLRLSFGSLEQFPARRRNQTQEEYEQVLCNAAKRRMADNCTEMHQRLQRTGQLRSIELREYKDEDHGSVVAAALNGGIIYFLETEDDER